MPFAPEFLARFDIKAPVRIPKSFHSNADKPTISSASRCRSSCRTCSTTRARSTAGVLISSRLTAEGEKAAALFLRQRAAAVAASSLSEDQTAGQAEFKQDGVLPLQRWKES